MSELKQDAKAMSAEEQQAYFQKLADEGTGIEMHGVTFVPENDRYVWYNATTKNNPQFPPYISSCCTGSDVCMAIGGNKKSVIVWGDSDVLHITKINDIRTKFEKYQSEGRPGYEAMLTEAEVKAMVGGSVYKKERE